MSRRLLVWDCLNRTPAS
uniref:Uncharacterized protein n=1 Tax=Arundo donax TaxID=35708 RepID=A0A0A9AWS5_ARUDO